MDAVMKLSRVVAVDRAFASAHASTASGSIRTPLVYCSPCLGIPPMLIASPFAFFAIQIAVGLVALAEALAASGLRSFPSISCPHW